jgi:hypothetical protein
MDPHAQTHNAVYPRGRGDIGVFGEGPYVVFTLALPATRSGQTFKAGELHSRKICKSQHIGCMRGRKEADSESVFAVGQTQPVGTIWAKRFTASLYESSISRMVWETYMMCRSSDQDEKNAKIVWSSHDRRTHRQALEPLTEQEAANHITCCAQDTNKKRSFHRRTG